MAVTSVPRMTQPGIVVHVPVRPVRLPAELPPSTRPARAHRSGPRSVDGFFRRGDTWLARGLMAISAGMGNSYTGSSVKRSLDLAVSVLLAVIVIPLLIVLATVNRLLCARHPAFFVQDRVGNADGVLRVVKIRSLVRGRIDHPGYENRPACTAFGRFLRRHYLDELPQLLQVLAGQLSLVGIRVLPRDVYEGLAASWSDERFARWKEMYAASPLGLTGIHQVLRGPGKEDERRFHRDMFYAKHATLGFDLYLLWRTFGTAGRGHSYTTT